MHGPAAPEPDLSLSTMSASTSTVAPEPPRPWPGRAWPPLLIVAAGGAAYANSFSGPLVLDDLNSIGVNPTIRHWGTALAPVIGTTVGGRPILNLSLAINYAISGTEVWSYHVLNLVIHLLAGLTLFGIVRRTLAGRAGRTAILIASFVALLWMLHPILNWSFRVDDLDVPDKLEQQYDVLAVGQRFAMSDLDELHGLDFLA